MGSSVSKTSRAVSGAARQYPTRPPPTSQAASNAPIQPPLPAAANRSPGPTVRPSPSASSTRSQEIDLDASDPHFAQSLRSLGAVQPNPTMSPSSAFPQVGQQSSRALGLNPRANPAIAVLEARARLQEEAEAEFAEVGKRGQSGRQFLDVYTIRQMLVMRDGQRRSSTEIERALGLKKGVVHRLGAPGVLELAQELGRAEKEINMV